MESSIPKFMPENDFETAWKARERYWQRKLGRLRLGAEPLEEQLARYRRATWMLTDISAVLALMFVGLFAAFQRPDVGGILALVLLAPIVALAWLDYGLLARRLAQYTREFQEHQKRTTPPGRT
jgi:hypothetical protein